MQPPFTPFFAIALIAIAWKSRAKFLLPLGDRLPSLPARGRALSRPTAAARADRSRETAPKHPALASRDALSRDRRPRPRTRIRDLPHPHKQGSPLDRTAYLRRVVPEYRALERAGTTRVYACHAERLKSYARPLPRRSLRPALLLARSQCEPARQPHRPPHRAPARSETLHGFAAAAWLYTRL